MEREDNKMKNEYEMKETSRGNAEEIAREKNYEALKKFFKSDVKIKETMLKLAPNGMEDYDEESRIKYTDKLYDTLRDLEVEFIDISQNFNFGLQVNEAIKMYFTKAKESLLTDSNSQGMEKYKTNISNMNEKLIEEVKDNCIGYTSTSSYDLVQLIGKAGSVNELLHIMHSYIVNNEEILKAMPIIATKKNE